MGCRAMNTRSLIRGNKSPLIHIVPTTPYWLLTCPPTPHLTVPFTFTCLLSPLPVPLTPPHLPEPEVAPNEGHPVGGEELSPGEGGPLIFFWDPGACHRYTGVRHAVGGWGRVGVLRWWVGGGVLRRWWGGGVLGWWGGSGGGRGVRVVKRGERTRGVRVLCWHYSVTEMTTPHNRIFRDSRLHCVQDTHYKNTV